MTVEVSPRRGAMTTTHRICLGSWVHRMIINSDTISMRWVLWVVSEPIPVGGVDRGHGNWLGNQKIRRHFWVNFLRMKRRAVSTPVMMRMPTLLLKYCATNHEPRIQCLFYALVFYCFDTPNFS